MIFHLSARAFHRILKRRPEFTESVSRTIADPSARLTVGLAGADAQTPHLAEALQYRPRGLG